MRAYRCFFLDRDNQFATTEIIDCADDEAAELRAGKLLADRPWHEIVEVWHHARLVSRHHGEAPPGSPDASVAPGSPEAFALIEPNAR